MDERTALIVQRICSLGVENLVKVGREGCPQFGEKSNGHTEVKFSPYL